MFVTILDYGICCFVSLVSQTNPTCKNLKCNSIRCGLNKIDSMDIYTDIIYEACNMRKLDVRRVVQM